MRNEGVHPPNRDLHEKKKKEIQQGHHRKIEKSTNNASRLD